MAFDEKPVLGYTKTIQFDMFKPARIIFISVSVLVLFALFVSPFTNSGRFSVPARFAAKRAHAGSDPQQRFGIVETFLSDQFSSELTDMKSIGVELRRNQHAMERHAMNYFYDVEPKPAWIDQEPFYILVNDAIQKGVELVFADPIWNYLAALNAEDLGGEFDPDLLQQREEETINNIVGMVEQYDGDGIDDAEGSPVIKYWQIGGELNITHVPGWFIKPAQYAQFLCKAYTEIKKASPRAVVLSGGIADIDVAYTNEFLEISGVRNCFDVLDLHVYPTIYRKIRDGEIAQIKAKMLEQGFSKPIWFTEIGTIGGFTTTYGQHFSEEFQARELVKRFVLLFNEGVEKIFWFKYRDAESQTDNAGHMGIVQFDGAPKRAYAAFKTMVSVLENFSTAKKLDLKRKNISVFKFMVQGESVWVIWENSTDNDPDAEIVVDTVCLDQLLPPSTKNAVVIGVNGSTSNYSRSSELTVSENPIFIKPYEVPLLAGDANGDGVVNSQDLELLKEDYLGEPKHNTDFNSDSRVDSEDFAILQANYTP